MNKVLIAEDNPANLELLREILELGRYQIVEARDGREALARIVEADPDLVLLDINMPVLDGYAVVRCIRQDPRYSRLPVVALSGDVMEDDRKEMLAAGFDICLPKPINFSVLLAEVRRLMAKGELLKP